MGRCGGRDSGSGRRNRAETAWTQGTPKSQSNRTRSLRGAVREAKRADPRSRDRSLERSKNRPGRDAGLQQHLGSTDRQFVPVLTSLLAARKISLDRVGVPGAKERLPLVSELAEAS
jgi:hypothetical protein